MAQDGPRGARIAPGGPQAGPMALEGAKINLNFMLGPPKMGPGAENKVCQANYAHFYEGNGGPQKYARRAQNARHHRGKRNTAARQPQGSRKDPVFRSGLPLGTALRS